MLTDQEFNNLYNDDDFINLWIGGVGSPLPMMSMDAFF